MGEAELVSSQSPSPLDEFAQKERWQILGRMIQGLSLKDRTFVQLYFVDGMSAEQVADEMRISIKTVYSKKHKIRCRLEAELLAESARAIA